MPLAEILSSRLSSSAWSWSLAVGGGGWGSGGASRRAAA